MFIPGYFAISIDEGSIITIPRAAIRTYTRIELWICLYKGLLYLIPCFHYERFAKDHPDILSIRKTKVHHRDKITLPVEISNHMLQRYPENNFLMQVEVAHLVIHEPHATIQSLIAKHLYPTSKS